MSDLIDRTNLIRILNEENVPFNASVNSIIISLPTVDAVEVIRCENCKYFSPNEKREKWGKCKIWKAQVLKDGYCSQGDKNEKN